MSSRRFSQARNFLYSCSFHPFANSCFTDRPTPVHSPATGDRKFNKQHQVQNADDGSDPSFEQLVRFGVDAASARIKTNFLTLVRQKPETPEEWAALTEAWEANCGYTPNSKDFQLIVELRWETDLE